MIKEHIPSSSVGNFSFGPILSDFLTANVTPVLSNLRKDLSKEVNIGLDHVGDVTNNINGYECKDSVLAKQDDQDKILTTKKH